MTKPYICIKIGGRAASVESALTNLIGELKKMKDQYQFILIHGGGAEVSRISKIFGLEPAFENGVRLTTPEEMNIADMVLSGLINKGLVRSLFAQGIRAVGLSGSDGGILIGEAISLDSRTGKSTQVNAGVLRLLLDDNIMPVFSSTAMDAEGKGLNINADEAAFAISTALPAQTLVFISDIPGVLRNDAVIENLSREDIDEAIASEVITGGMIPKVRSSADALEKGIGSVIIGGYEKEGDLHALLAGQKGTRITKETTHT
ncbi:MAG: acetylglutamate kinase [Spirochaetales bacterium]|jgi:acetylglutamate kinase|nr:acetylglutamate kinase [Spirochaetales bacterium]